MTSATRFSAKAPDGRKSVKAKHKTRSARIEYSNSAGYQWKLILKECFVTIKQPVLRPRGRAFAIAAGLIETNEAGQRVGRPRASDQLLMLILKPHDSLSGSVDGDAEGVGARRHQEQGPIG